MLDGVDAVGADTPAGRAAAPTPRTFFAFLQEEMPALLERWREQRSH